MAGIALAATVPCATTAGAQGIGYTLTPAAAGIRWEEGLGLRNKALYGGMFALDFEQWLSLEAYYLTNNGVRTALDELDLSGDATAGLGDRRLQVRSYGANLRIPFAIGGTIAPYLMAGGGILDFRPDDGDRSRQIALNAGGGVRIPIASTLHLDLFAHDAMFRVDRTSFFQPGGSSPDGDPDADDLRHNFVFGGGIGIPFGASRTGFTAPAQRASPWGLSGASFSLEPTAGRMMFDSDAIPDQDLAGIRAGVDLGRLVGIRGFYWRGVEDNFTSTAPLQGWGAEAQLRLNPGPGVTPFILLGGAQLDFRSEFQNTAGDPVSDETALILGGGVAVPLTERLALNFTARDHLVSESRALENVSQPSELTHNWMYSVGLRFSLGGREGSDMARARAARQARVADELARERARRDSLERMLAEREEVREAEREQAAREDTREARRTTATLDERRREDERKADQPAAPAARTTPAPPPGSYVTGRDVTIPAPAEGELYVRYGPERERSGDPAGSRAQRGTPVPPSPVRGAERAAYDEDDLRDIVARAVRDELSVHAAREAEELRREATMREAMRDAVRDAMPMQPRDARPIDRAEPSVRTEPRAMPTQPRPQELRESAGDVERAAERGAQRAIERAAERPLVAKEQPQRATDVRDARGTTDSTERRVLDDIRSEVRALLDSIRQETRGEREPLQPAVEDTAAQLEQRIVDRVDSIVRARYAGEREAAERERMERERQLREREQQLMERERELMRPRPTAGSDVVMPRRSLPLVSYAGANLTDGVQGIIGTRVDLGPMAGYSSLHFVPELALGWGEGARSVMATGNVQLRFPALRFGGMPPIMPQVALGAGLLHFNHEVQGRDGVDGVLNLGYGAAIDLWRGSNNVASPVLVVEHQGVDLFSLNRLLTGIRWRF